MGRRASRRPLGSPRPEPLAEEDGELDPITHTFVGASLSAAGLRRTTALATPTLILAANAPDVDVLAYAAGPYAALAWRRGITHGIPALIVLPFLVAGGVLAWDRWVRRRRNPGLPGVHPPALLGIAAIGVWTHPALDWVNTYGMRWLMPLDDPWTYGDAVFILDPWIWLLLGGGLFLAYSRTLPTLAAWAALAGAMTLLVFLSESVPPGARMVWVAGITAWILLRAAPGSPAGRAGTGAPSQHPRNAGIVRGTVAATIGYLLLMILQTPLADRAVRAEARDLGLEGIESTMVGPVPAHPLRRQVILRTEAGYHRGTFSWTRSPRLLLDPGFLPLAPPDPRVSFAADHPEARHFLTWSRFPWISTEPTEDGWNVHFRDVRYLDREGAGALSGITIEVGADLRTRQVPP